MISDYSSWYFQINYSRIKTLLENILCVKGTESFVTITTVQRKYYI